MGTRGKDPRWGQGTKVPEVGDSSKFNSQCPVPQHTHCSPELQTPCSINYFHFETF